MRFVLGILTCILFAPHATLAQHASTVAPGDPAYRDLDRLIDRGLVIQVIVGQRPYSRHAMYRMGQEAAARLDSAGDDGRSTALDRAALRRLLLVTAPRDTQMAATSAWTPRMFRAEALFTDQVTRPVAGNGLGTIEADLNTFTDNRFGRSYRTGSNLALESEHVFELPLQVAMQARPRAWVYDSPGSDAGASLALVAGSVHAVRRNIALTLGREYTHWSSGDDFGLFFSPNAPALDMVRLASDVPWVLPSVLRLLGPTAATLQVADVGRSVNNSHSLLVAYKVSVRPAPVLELGASFENHFGGSGAQGTSAVNRLVDLMPFIDVFRRHADSTDVVSDKLIAADARLRLPSLANASLFAEFALEDFDLHRLYSVFHEDGAYVFGVLLPVLPLPSLSARIALHATGIRFYEHHLITNGIAARRFTLGDDLGHDSQGTSLKVRWEGLSGASVTASGDLEERSNDTMTGTYTNPDQTGLVFRRVATLPRERRLRLVLGGRRPAASRMTVDASLGAERVANFGFDSAPPAWHGLAAVGASFRP